jgi:hypothetical protein
MADFGRDDILTLGEPVGVARAETSDDDIVGEVRGGCCVVEWSEVRKVEEGVWRWGCNVVTSHSDGLDDVELATRGEE